MSYKRESYAELQKSFKTVNCKQLVEIHSTENGGVKFMKHGWKSTLIARSKGNGLVASEYEKKRALLYGINIRQQRTSVREAL